MKKMTLFKLFNFIETHLWPYCEQFIVAHSTGKYSFIKM